jgi:hypothetical protein
MTTDVRWSLPFIAVGQECLCPDGYGRVTKWNTSPLRVTTVSVATHVNNRECTWDSNNVILVPPFGSDRPLIRADQLLDANRLKPFMEVELE